MKSLVVGHKYELPLSGNPGAGGQTLQFLHTEPVVLPDGQATGEIRVLEDGADPQDVLWALVDHLRIRHAGSGSKSLSEAVAHLVKASASLSVMYHAQERKAEESK